MEYFVGERDLSQNISPCTSLSKGVSLRLTIRRGGGNALRDGAERGEKRSHRKPNTMVIRGESASVLWGYQFHPPQREDPIQHASFPLRQLPGIENLLNFPIHPTRSLPLLSLSLALRSSLDLIGDRLFDILIIRLFDCHRGWV